MSKLTRVFVYGTLKRGHPNHYLLSEQNSQYGVARLVGAASLVNKYPLVIFGQYNIPFLLAEEGQGENVRGELYDVDGKMLAKLDDLEVHPRLYTRTSVDCLLDQSPTGGNGSIVKADVYMLFNFNKAMLAAPYLSDYCKDTIKDRGYAFREDRDADYDIFSEVKEQ